MSGATLSLAPASPRRWWRAGPRILPLALVVPILAITVWHFVSAAGLVPPLVLPAPAEVAQALREMIADGTIGGNLAISLRRGAAGFLLGGACGFSLGAVMGLFPVAARALRPTLFAVLHVPILAWIPLLMIPFGIGETLKYVVIGIAAFTPTLVHTVKSLNQVPSTLIEVGRIYRLSWHQRLRHILLPAALPGLFTGFRLGMTQAWQSLVVVELVASTSGIGYVCVMARQVFRLDQMFAVMVVIGVVGYTLDRALRATEARLARQWGAA
jgi:sulfonate transport system permease protein